MCKKLKEVYEGARTMTWLSGSANMQRKQFERLKAEMAAPVSAATSLFI